MDIAKFLRTPILNICVLLLLSCLHHGTIIRTYVLKFHPHIHISGLQTYKYFIPSPQFYLTRMLFTLLLSNFLQQQKNTFMLHRYLVSKLVNDTHREKLYCTQFSTFFHMFAQSFRFYTFHYDV